MSLVQKLRTVSLVFAVLTVIMSTIMLMAETMFTEEQAKLVVVPMIITVLTLSGLTIGGYYLDQYMKF